MFTQYTHWVVQSCLCVCTKVNIALMNLASIILDPSLREKHWLRETYHDIFETCHVHVPSVCVLKLSGCEYDGTSCIHQYCNHYYHNSAQLFDFCVVHILSSVAKILVHLYNYGFYRCTLDHPWHAITFSDNIETFETYINQYPDYSHYKRRIVYSMKLHWLHSMLCLHWSLVYT